MDEITTIINELEIYKGIAILAVLGFGVFSLIMVFRHMKKGFGTFNVRIAGIVIVATFVSILAVLSPTSESAAIGILGAITGYLFGYGVPTDKDRSTNSGSQNTP